MSETTLEALQIAIDTHIADESPDNPITGAWVIHCETTSIENLGDDDRNSMWVVSKGNNWTIRGMIHEWLYGEPDPCDH